jgi:ethanolamine utilization protein EutA (predicted chaperonin)
LHWKKFSIGPLPVTRMVKHSPIAEMRFLCTQKTITSVIIGHNGRHCIAILRGNTEVTSCTTCCLNA